MSERSTRDSTNLCRDPQRTSASWSVGSTRKKAGSLAVSSNHADSRSGTDGIFVRNIECSWVVLASPKSPRVRYVQARHKLPGGGRLCSTLGSSRHAPRCWHGSTIRLRTCGKPFAWQQLCMDCLQCSHSITSLLTRPPSTGSGQEHSGSGHQQLPSSFTPCDIERQRFPKNSAQHAAWATQKPGGTHHHRGSVDERNLQKSRWDIDVHVPQFGIPPHGGAFGIALERRRSESGT